MSKILLSAYSCDPERGSEPGVGWHWVRELSKSHELWVMFYAPQLPAVEKAVAQLPQKKNIHLCPLDVPPFLRQRLFRLRYEVWDQLAYRMAKKLAKEVEFSLVHHVTIAAWWNCGHLWKLPIPFVFGPIVGNLHTPPATFPFLSRKARTGQKLRSLVLSLAWNCWRRPRKAMRKAALVLASTQATAEAVRDLRGEKPIGLMSNNGVDLSGITPVSAEQLTGRQLRMIFSGRMIPTKNLGLLFEALRCLPPSVDWRLRIAGDGPERANWEKQAREYGLADRIEFLGSIPHKMMLALYKWANVFVFPSSREGNATVILEAMAYGLPIVALRISGHGLLLDDQTALLVDLENAEQMSRDFARMLELLHLSPGLRQSFGSAARRRIARELAWEPRMNVINRWYREILADSSPGPSRETGEVGHRAIG